MAIFNTHIKRPRYFDRQQLTAEDLSLGQAYHQQRTQELNRHLHGWGVVCGAMVEQRETRVDLSEGFAISPTGISIFIPNVENLDLDDMIAEACGEAPRDCEGEIRSTEPPGRGPELPEQLYLIARPVDVPTDPRPAIPEDCAHSGNHMAHSRICESVCLELICDLPPLHQTPIIPCDDLHQLICRRGGDDVDLGRILRTHFACPPQVAEGEDFVVLATLQIVSNRDRRGPLPGLHIHYYDRRLLMPTQMLQHYLSCLCDRPQPTQTPTLTPTFTVTPTATLTFTIRPTQTFTIRPTQTFTIRPTQTFTIRPTQTFTIRPTETFTIRPTQTFTVFPTETFTIRPTFGTGIPTEVPTRIPIFGRIGALTRPVDPLLFEGIDVREFDTVRGDNVSIDALVLLSDEDKSALHNLGVNSVLDLYVADTPMIAEELDISEVRVAEYRDNALESMRRHKPLALDMQEFDLESGMRANVEEVHNVGRSRGRALTEAGYASVADVANAETAELREVLSVSEPVAEALINDARTRMRRP